MGLLKLATEFVVYETENLLQFWLLNKLRNRIERRNG